MDRIIESISKIEDGSVKIMEDANARKSEISAQIQRETEEFDKELEVETSKRIETLREDLEQDMKTKLKRQKDYADQSLQNLKNHYESCRETYVEQLFKEMTRV